MQIVTDSGVDLSLTPEQTATLNIHVVPLIVRLDGMSYREGVDVQPGEFYRMRETTDSFPTTSQPSAGDFADIYPVTDPDILSIHLSSSLSGTYNSALAGAELVPEAHVTHVDTKTLSGAAGWQVQAAAHALKAGWPQEQVLALMKRIAAASETMYTVRELRYLIHGGRIGHMKGLVASALRIKPLIGVNKTNGKSVQLGQSRTFKRAIKGLLDLIARRHSPGSALRVQVLHAHNPEGAAKLRALVDERFDCTWLPKGTISLVLGAHSSPSLVGIGYAPLAAFADVGQSA